MEEDDPIVQLSEEMRRRGRRARRPPPTDQSERPIIRVMPGEITRVVDESERALLGCAGLNLYCYGSKLVQVGWDTIRVSGGGKERVLRHLEATAPWVLEQFEGAARYVKWSVQSDDWVACDCPKDVAVRYLARGKWGVPTLLGVSTAPVMLADGRIIDEPGYHEESGTIYDPLGVRFRKVADDPSKESALEALGILKRLLRGFPFVGPADLSVALSGIMTAVMRFSMPVAPMHAFDAPTAGTGKSNLTDIASAIATGHRAAVTSKGQDKTGDNEFEKSLKAHILGGDPVISLDNMEDPVGGQLLNQAMTQRMLSIRIFGVLKIVRAPSIATWFANGNNIIIFGDMTRRVLLGRMDARIEQPETLKFNFEPVELALRARPLLLWCVHTIVRAWLRSGDRFDDLVLGSYREWCELIRKPLVWLGEVDPCEVMARTRGDDPKLSRLREIMTVWLTAVGEGQKVMTRDVVAIGMATTERNEYGDGGAPAHPELREALMSVAGIGDRISPDRLGQWLRKNLDRATTLDGIMYKFTQEDKETTRPKWVLRKLG